MLLDIKREEKKVNDIKKYDNYINDRESIQVLCKHVEVKEVESTNVNINNIREQSYINKYTPIIVNLNVNYQVDASVYTWFHEISHYG